MDLSKSMQDDKEKLSALGDTLAESMRNITSNFRLGFGSFVDKVVMPYVSVVPKKLEEPCDECKKPYGYRNHMALDSDTNRFADEVKSAAVSGNLDAPEGGFDAIMQAVVCREKIGWREKARRLLVFSTDAGFHYAGDGKLGGIVKPNDGQCHLDGTGLYTQSTTQDYPSVSQINLKVKENAINVIFAVTQEQIHVYNRLMKHIEGSFAGVLSNDSSNVVELVKDQYDRITSSVELKDTASSKHVKITYYSNCLDPKGNLQQTSKCDGLKVDSEVRFLAEVEVKTCPPNKKDWIQTFQIYPVGINESLTVKLEMQCDCPCENEGNVNFFPNAPQCSGYGDYKCGVCECDSSHFGRHCECDAQSTKQDDSGTGCRPDNTTLIDCSGRGTCACGQCQCDNRPNPEEVISGTFCECDNFSCDRVDGVLCSGPEHGTCVCGKCQCLDGWDGQDCSCSTNNNTCMAPGSTEVCSGKGDCVCGKCSCHTEAEGRYSGKYCEKCPTCPGRCLELRDCVQCQVHKSGPLTEEECATNCTFVPAIVEGTVEADESKDENFCAYYDEEDCRYTYVYTYDEKGKLLVRAQKDKECPPEVYVLGIVLGVIGAIVLIGLALLLLWKLLTTIQDRREFAKFEKQTMMMKWERGENPLYKQATSTFKNPIYAGRD
uniref:Integrin beta n=1 Tax=Lygus hesperus TaxID=30085 RepID=A0A146KXD2_LYGHE